MYKFAANYDRPAMSRQLSLLALGWNWQVVFVVQKLSHLCDTCCCWMLILTPLQATQSLAQL